ncbi:hypothetical protein PENSUB_13906 [Penicillium subrubescens]|uniref:Uncharacterized protein n=1 Tax=Penicillium subrubescens TaxID=1316194 RepID=A0A1Q5UQ18_9EURO|nr:hypothetical protein PENSUB_13906 [Penicillium subrubescens]
MFYAHLLSPFNFQKDMELNYPNLWKAEIEFPLAKILSTNTDEESKLVWKEEYPDIPYQIVEFTPAGEPIYVTENAMDIHGYKCHWIGCLWRAANVIPMIKWAKYRVSRTDLVCPGCNHRIRAAKAEDALELCQREFGFPIFNLWDSPQRQFGKQGFVDRILALAQNQDQTQDQFQDHVFRYLKFLQLMKENQNTLVPTLDIDLIWHTHQLSPVAYEKYCKTHIGRPINHVDTIRAMRRSKKEDNTASLWATRYSESYHDPQNPEKTAEIERRKAACQKDSEDIEAKLTAFDKDHEHLKKDLDEIKVRLETKLADYRTVQDASTALNAEIAGIETSIRSIKPKLRLPGLRYYNKQQKQHIAKLQNKLQPLGERRLYKSREVESRYHEYDREYQDQRHKLGLSNTARRERQALEQQLTRKVTEAKAAIWRFKGEQLEDRYNGSWYSIVPSEAQLGVYPILDDPANRIIFYRGYVGSSGVGGYGGSDGGFGVGCSGFGDAGCGAGCGGGSGGGCGGS